MLTNCGFFECFNSTVIFRQQCFPYLVALLALYSYTRIQRCGTWGFQHLDPQIRNRNSLPMYLSYVGTYMKLTVE